MWSEILRVEHVGVNDDFFELGGDSFAAAVLLSEVQASYALPGGVLERIDFVDAPTIAAMASAIGQSVCSGNRDAARHPAAVALQPHGSRTPLFFIPWVDEDPRYLMALSRRLGDEQPFFVLRDPVLPEERGVYSLADSAGKYVEAMRTIQPEGSYLVGGHCLGGIVAFEAARQLRSAGEDVPLLVLFDAPTPGYPSLCRHWRLYARGVGYHLAALLSEPHKGAQLRRALQAARSHTGRLARGAVERLFARMGWETRVMKTRTNTSDANMQAARLYTPTNYPGPLVLMLAKGHEQHGSPLDRRLGWTELAGDGVEVHTVEGGHLTLLTEPLVEETAARLKEMLERAAVERGAA
jgi:thioesterase domain-containing protein